jgi:hypothetical protein
MTNKKARARARARAKQKQIPCGNDKKVIREAS